MGWGIALFLLFAIWEPNKLSTPKVAKAFTVPPEKRLYFEVVSHYWSEVFQYTPIETMQENALS